MGPELQNPKLWIKAGVKQKWVCTSTALVCVSAGGYVMKVSYVPLCRSLMERG